MAISSIELFYSYTKLFGKWYWIFWNRLITRSLITKYEPISNATPHGPCSNEKIYNLQNVNTYECSYKFPVE